MANWARLVLGILKRLLSTKNGLLESNGEIYIDILASSRFPKLFALLEKAIVVIEVFVLFFFNSSFLFLLVLEFLRAAFSFFVSTLGVLRLIVSLLFIVVANNEFVCLAVTTTLPSLCRKICCVHFCQLNWGPDDKFWLIRSTFFLRLRSCMSASIQAM